MKLVRWILAMAFAVTGGLKIGAMWRFSGQETVFGELPAWVQWLVVAVEMCLAIWIVSNWRTKLAAFAAITLLSLFLSVILIEMGNDAPTACGCLGVIKMENAKEGLWISLGLDGLLLAAALATYFGDGPTQQNTEVKKLLEM
jgi:hypothetical protein